MRSKLLGREQVRRLLESESAQSIIGELIQTDYRQYLDEFGGVKAREGMVDFALSRSFEANVQRLVGISPYGARRIMAAIVSSADYESMKLVLHAKYRGMGFDSIAKYIVGSGRLPMRRIRSAMDCQGLEEAARELGESTPYAGALAGAMEAYRREGSLAASDTALDMSYYSALGGALSRLMTLSPESGRLVRLGIESRNILTLIRLKRAGAPIERARWLLVRNGITSERELLDMYGAASGPQDIAAAVRTFALDHSAAHDGRVELLRYEMLMRNQLLRRAVSVLGGGVLSFGAIVAYYYMKQMEIATVRAILNGRYYGMSREEIEGMVAW